MCLGTLASNKMGSNRNDTEAMPIYYALKLDLYMFALESSLWTSRYSDTFFSRNPSGV